MMLADGAETTRDGFDAFRVPVDAVLRTVLTSAEAGQTLHDKAREVLRELVRDHVVDGPGALVLTGLPADELVGRTSVLSASGLLGRTLPQDREGLTVKEVRDRGTAVGEGSRARYSDSRFGGNLHTDGAEAPLPPPDYFILFCVRQSRRGGELVLLHVRDILRALADRPSVERTLREDFHFDRRGDQGPGESPTTRKPVLFEYRHRTAITYLRRYIEIGHKNEDVSRLSDAQMAALDALDEVTDESRAVVGKLAEGELAIIDNLSMLHGRKEFIDDEDHPRLLLRTWIHSDPW